MFDVISDIRCLVRSIQDAASSRRAVIQTYLSSIMSFIYSGSLCHLASFSCILCLRNIVKPRKLNWFEKARRPQRFAWFGCGRSHELTSCPHDSNGITSHFLRQRYWYTSTVSIARLLLPSYTQRLANAGASDTNKDCLGPILFHVAIPANCVNGHCICQVIFGQEYLVYLPQVQSLVDICYDASICMQIGDCPWSILRIRVKRALNWIYVQRN